MDIIEMLKSNRFFRLGFKKLLTPKQFKEMEKLSEYAILESEDVFSEKMVFEVDDDDEDQHMGD